MRSLIATAALVSSIASIAQTQVPNVFEDGTPASAAEVNENFQYVMENASGGGGCSATQQDNSVLIESAEGTSGVLAGAGTVVAYPEASSGVVDPSTVATGDVVLMDSNDIVLGRALDLWNNIYTIVLPIPDLGACYIHVWGGSAGEPITTGSNRGQGYFQSDDCSGQMLIQRTGWCDYIQGNYYFGAAQVYGDVLSKSELWPDGCRVEEKIHRNTLSFPTLITLPPEILNAAYPVRLEQLP